MPILRSVTPPARGRPAMGGGGGWGGGGGGGGRGGRGGGGGRARAVAARRGLPVDQVAPAAMLRAQAAGREAAKAGA